MGWCRMCPFLGLSTVKYIREVSPLFKKPSLVADLPWDGVRPQSPSYSGSEDSGSPKHGSSSPSKDRKVISLKMCFISRNLTMPDLENRYVGQQPTASCLNTPLRGPQAHRSFDFSLSPFAFFITILCRSNFGVIQTAGASLTRRPTYGGAALQRRPHRQLLVHCHPHEHCRPAATSPGSHQRLPGSLIFCPHAPPPQTHRLVGWAGAVLNQKSINSTSRHIALFIAIHTQFARWNSNILGR